jgi:hypothetical protein
MTSQLEIHILSRLDEISAGVARLETSHADHLKAHADYDAAKRFQTDLRRGRFWKATTALISLATVALAAWRVL